MNSSIKVMISSPPPDKNVALSGSDPVAIVSSSAGENGDE